MQPGKCELHLGLHAPRAGDVEPRGPLDRGLQQRRLADPRLAAHHEHPALAATGTVEQPIQALTLNGPPS
jgi:hypothetical protein